MMYDYTEVDDEIHHLSDKSKIMYKDKEVLLCCSLNEGRKILMFVDDDQEPLFFCTLDDLTFDMKGCTLSHIFPKAGVSDRMDLFLSRIINYEE